MRSYRPCKYHLQFGKFWILLAIFVLGSACGVRKTVPKGEKILTKNKFEVESDRLIDYNISNEIQSQVLYKPNRRVFLGRVPFFLWLYSFGTKSKAPELSDSKKWRKSLRKQGEPPVLLDTSKIILNVSNIQNYLFNNGYFRTLIFNQQCFI